MRKFILKTLFFAIPIIIFVVIVMFKAGGHLDPFYVRFTTPKHQNMILGTSRAAQGLQPKVFKSVLNKNMGNFAFTVAHSPFGKVYYESIKRKLDKKKGSLFIVTVDPWSISSKCSPPNNISEFRENALCLNKTKILDLDPNIFYLYENFSGRYKDLIDSKNNNMYLHEDGWLEISDIAMDSVSVSHRIADKTKTYKNIHLPKTKFSSLRLEYLIKTIDYLKDYGRVYLVRLPIHESIMKIEEQLMPDFDTKIKEAIYLSNGYLDMTVQNELFEYTDGNHLYKTSGEEVSIKVANWIKEQDKKRTHSRVVRSEP